MSFIVKNLNSTTPSFQVDYEGYIYFDTYKFKASDLGKLLSHIQSIYFPEDTI